MDSLRHVEWIHKLQLEEESWITIRHWLDTAMAQVRVGIPSGAMMLCPTDVLDRNKVRVRIPPGWDMWPLVVIVDDIS